AGWRTVEAPADLVAALRAVDGEACAIVDCLSLWVSNRLLAAAGEAPAPEQAERLEAALVRETADLLALAGGRAGPVILVSNEVGWGVVPPTPLGRVYRDLLALAGGRAGPVILVSNEVGWGVVPPTPLGRVYRDLLGRVNQRAAADATRAWLLVAGRALELPPP
ncbi:MAG: hypothetical protein FJZ92_09130, partial [Chloroflexi bacterium]|nr:hypothetical protein [Chloroflexota bacterium]